MTITEYNELMQKRNRGKSAPTEHDLQVSCVRWFRYSYPQEIIMAIPNGGYRSPKTAAIMKAEGQLAGVPDLFIPAAKGDYHGLWIEMKNGKAGRLSESQQTMIEHLRQLGHRVEIVRSFDEFANLVQEYLK